MASGSLVFISHYPADADRLALLPGFEVIDILLYLLHYSKSLSLSGAIAASRVIDFVFFIGND